MLNYIKLFPAVMPVVLNLRLHDADTNITADIPAEIKTYYQDELIYSAEPKLFYHQLGMKANIPAGRGKTAEWRKPTPYAKALTAITEGQTPTGHDIDVQTVTVTVDQYGDFGKISDMLKVTALDNIIVMETKLQGGQAGRTIDTVVREVVTAGSQKLFAPLVSGGTETPTLLREDITAGCYLTSDLLNQAAAVLENNNADGIDGEEFVAIVHTDIWRELMRQDDWIDAAKYQGVKEIFRGERGMIGNVRFLATSEAKIIGPEDMLGIPGYTRTVLNAATLGSSKDIYPKKPFSVAVAAEVTARINAGAEYKIYVNEVEYTVDSVTGGDVGTCKITMTDNVAAAAEGKVVCGVGAGTDGSAVYCTMLIGNGAYGVTEVEGLGLEHIVKQLGSAGTADPLNQRATIGWKTTMAAVRLVEENMVRIEHTSKWFRTQRNSN